MLYNEDMPITFTGLYDLFSLAPYSNTFGLKHLKADTLSHTPISGLLLI